MNPILRMLLCILLGVAACQCSSSSKKKKKNPAEMSLEERARRKPDNSMLNERSQFEKHLTSQMTGKGLSGSYLEKQKHHAGSFVGANEYAGGKQFKTEQSWFGKSKAPGMDMTYALGDKQAGSMSSRFKTDGFDTRQAREGSSVFSGADGAFKTRSALTRSQNIGRAPNIIENYNDRGGGKKSAYTEDEVKRLLNRN